MSDSKAKSKYTDARGLMEIPTLSKQITIRWFRKQHAVPIQGYYWAINMNIPKDVF
jgi:hypothetical protein